jgi:acetyl-CoA carboxylase biotin carboxyl carrier protein
MAGSSVRKKTQKAVVSSRTTSGESVSPLNLADIKELFVLMRENEIAELQLEQDKTKIHIVSKGAAPASNPAMMSMMTGVPQMINMHPAHVPHQQVMQVPVTGDVTGISAGAGGEGAAGESSEPSNAKTIYSPMVGTFYSAPAPDAPSFVKPGDPVSEETVLCIIEAMKLMNEIKAETKGRVLRILVENGVPVEFNQPLFLIEP